VAQAHIMADTESLGSAGVAGSWPFQNVHAEVGRGGLQLEWRPAIKRAEDDRTLVKQVC
jgi:hypothetical protein